MRHALSIALSGLLLWSACGSDESFVVWQLTLSDPSQQSRVAVAEVQILRGGCASADVVYQNRFGQGVRAEVPPTLPPGRYGFSARVRDSKCVWFAAGCEERELPLKGVVDVQLRVTSPMLERGCNDSAPDGDDAGTPVDPAPSVLASCEASVDGLAACYSFEQDLQDGSGNGNHASSSDASFEPGVSGSALRVGQAPVSVPDSPSLDVAQSLTVELWARVDRYGDSSTMLLDNDDQYYLAVNSDGSLEAGLYGQGTLFRFTSAAGAVPLGSWVHVACTFDGARVALFRNGALLGQQQHDVPLDVASEGPMHVGSASPAGTRLLAGAVDELRVWDVARRAVDICASAELGGVVDCDG